MSKAVGSQKTSSKTQKEKPGNNVDSSQSDNSCDEKVSNLISSTNLPSYVTVPEPIPIPNEQDDIHFSELLSNESCDDSLSDDECWDAVDEGVKDFLIVMKMKMK